MELIKLVNISKTYQPKKVVTVEALKEVNLTINNGESVSIEGVSGSGKSTLLHIIGCLDSATTGEYYLDNEKIEFSNNSKISKIRNQKIGFVLQKFGLLNDRTAIENVCIPALFAGISLKKAKEKAMELLRELDIYHLAGVAVNCLSGGEQQRVAIARALINDPQIILADEPTGALDSKTSSEIVDILTGLTKKGKTLIMVTHDKEVANRCEKNYTIKDGILIERKKDEE